MEKLYEHHYKLKSDKLCPFKLERGERSDANFYNWHKNIEIIFVIDGEGEFQYSTDKLKVKSGDMVVINSEIIHRPGHEIEFFYLIIDESFFCENGFSLSDLDFLPVVRDPECEKLFMTVEEKSREYKSAEIHPASLRSAVLSLILYLYSHYLRRETNGEPPAAVTQSCIKTALEFINERYTDGITLSDIADACNVTGEHLAREFKRHTGQTVIAYINALRCKRAALSISLGSSVTEAAMECGFGSLSYFSRTYKRVIGAAPSTAKTKSN
jgi:AraC-like DNA-binding protein